jgi:acyl dehydratase
VERKKYGNDFKMGETFTTAAITVTETHLVNWAGLTMDFYSLHMDKEFAAKTQFGERLAHGPMIFGLAVGLLGISQYAQDSVIAWLGVNNMKMLGPVKIGDTIHVETEVTDQKTTKDPARGVQTWRYSVVNQRDEKVMVFDYIMMFHMRV